MEWTGECVRGQRSSACLLALTGTSGMGTWDDVELRAGAC